MFVIVRVCGVVVVPTVILPNWKALLLGLMTGATPVPESDTDSAVGFELAIVSVAPRAPVAVGLKVTKMLQLAPPTKALVQVVVCAKSPALTPVMLMPLMASVPAPAAFVTVTVCPMLVVFTNTFPKVSGVGDTVAFAAVPTMAVFDQPELRLPRIEALYVWDILPAQPLSTAWLCSRRYQGPGYPWWV